MRRGLLILISAMLLFTASLSGQCPDKDFLFKRIRFVKDSSGFSPQKKLAELLGYLDKMDSCPYRNDSTHLYLIRRIAEIYFFEQADFLKAVQYRRQAIDIISANAGKPSIDIKTLPGFYYWLSVAYDSLNNINGRMTALDSCFTIAMRLNHVDRSSLMALFIRVKYLYDVGDYHRCIDYAARCRLLGQLYADNNSGLEKNAGERYVFSSLGWEVNTLLKLKKFEQAEVLMKNKIEEYRKQGLKDYLGLAYGQLADVQEQKGNFEMALFYFNQCLKCYEEIGDQFNYKQTLKDIAYKIYFRHLKDGDKALVYYKKALKYLNKEKNLASYDVFESLHIYTLIANVYAQKRLFDSAFQYFRMAFDQIKPGYNEKDILESLKAEFLVHRNVHYLTGLLIDKGNAFLKQYEKSRQKTSVQEAIRIYKMADTLLDRVKLKQRDPESKLFWRSDSRRLYENAIEACYLLNNTTDAFYFFEKSRAVLLNDQLNEQQWMGEKEILKQTQLKKSILNLERGVAREKKSGAKSAFQSQIFSAKQELDRLEQSIKAQNPLYYQNFLDTGFISLSYAQKNLLNENQALLEIFSGDSAVYVLLITARHSFLKKIHKQDYENTVSEYISYISNSSLLNRDFAGYVKVAFHLYNMIFKDKLQPGQRLIISPDGQYFPFESLVSTNAVQSPGYLINDHAVSYTYSARFLMNDFKSAPGKGRNFMGVAPVNYPLSFSLASLPGSDQSLQRIGNYFRYSAKQVAIDATRNNFLQQFSGYKIIQLYTHSADSSVNNEPVIYFADSALYLSDLIHESKPVTRLIVLSACETGRGKLYNGEGVFSFNRGFAALGIPAAITNLWSVDNESTYKLTELFYKFLSKGLPTDVALQKAKLEFLKNASGEKSLPFYWAAPVLVGKSDAIQLERTQRWKWIALFAGVGCIVFFVVRKWTISKKAA